jgi:hypothetical protein
MEPFISAHCASSAIPHPGASPYAVSSAVAEANFCSQCAPDRPVSISNFKPFVCTVVFAECHPLFKTHFGAHQPNAAAYWAADVAPHAAA